EAGDKGIFRLIFRGILPSSVLLETGLAPCRRPVPSNLEGGVVPKDAVAQSSSFPGPVPPPSTQQPEPEHTQMAHCCWGLNMLGNIPSVPRFSGTTSRWPLFE